MNTLPRAREKAEVDFDHVHRRKFSDPLIQTAKVKLQHRRSKVSDEIDKELRLRSGAENLFKASSNKKMRDTVALELSFVNSNLQLLKEELSELNSSVDIYQNTGATLYAPLIPLGLKETKEVDFTKPLMDFLLEHYSEDGETYAREILFLMDLRQSCRTPARNQEGISLLLQYYNRLYFIDKRFFPPNRNMGIYFEWYDSLTGVPSSQKTVGFEKGSILFNIGALYTQIGARQDRSQFAGVDAATDNFQRAAGAFHYLRDNFSHAPSMDMKSDSLNMLQQLMLSQAQECIFESKVLGGIPNGMKHHVNIAHEAGKVFAMYKETHRLMSVEPVKEYVPITWISMVEVKSQYFKALSHYHTAVAMLDQIDSDNVDLMAEIFLDLHVRETCKKGGLTLVSVPPTNTEDRQNLAKAHLRYSILFHEEALRIHNLSKQLRRIDTFHDILKQSHDRSLEKFSELEEEDDFTELRTVPNIQAMTDHSAESVFPDFSEEKVDDLFTELGPIAIFCARHQWTAPRLAELKKDEAKDFGFSVRADAPVIIAAVEPNSIAQKSGMKEGDFIVRVGDVDVKSSKHKDVVALIRRAGNHLVMRVVTPLDYNYLEDGVMPCTPKVPTKMQATNTLPRKEKGSIKSKSGSSWTLRRRRSRSKEKPPKDLSNGDSYEIYTR